VVNKPEFLPEPSITGQRYYPGNGIANKIEASAKAANARIRYRIRGCGVGKGEALGDGFIRTDPL
jgi:hypothetical protein